MEGCEMEGCEMKFNPSVETEGFGRIMIHRTIRSVDYSPCLTIILRTTELNEVQAFVFFILPSNIP